MKARWNVVDTLPLEERTIARVRTMGTVAALLALATASTGGRAGSRVTVHTLPVGPWPTAMVPMPPGRIDLVACRRTQRVFVFHGGNVSVLDTASGRLLRTVAIGPPRGLGPAVVDEHDGRLFLVNWLTGAILVLNARTGRVVRIIVVGGVPTDVVVSQRLGRVFVSTPRPPGGRVITGREGNGSVHVLDGRSGTIVRTWPVGQLPGPIAVDERHRYLVVLNLNGSDLGAGPWAWIPAWLHRWLPFLPGVPVIQTLASSMTVIDISRL